MKRRFPLFIIDSSRSHGRNRETDYISCTSVECPFVAEALLLHVSELQLDNDWLNKNDFSIFSEPVNDIRIKLKVVQYSTEAKPTQIKSLLKRGLKEYQKRRMTVQVDYTDIKNKDIVWFCDTLLGQSYENLRENPEDLQAKTVKAILEKIKDNYAE